MPMRLQRARMRLMRGLVHEFNIYRWAGRMLLDAATVRREALLHGHAGARIKHTRSSDRPAPTARGGGLALMSGRGGG
jgi:hypothetical protein